MYMLDTNVVSELRRPRPHGGVLAWIDSIHPAELKLPAIVVGEIQAGIEHVRPHDPEKARQFDLWLSDVLESFSVVPMDGEIFRLWARLMVGRQQHLTEDAMIAATALRFDQIVVTRNTQHIDIFGARTFNPFV